MSALLQRSLGHRFATAAPASRLALSSRRVACIVRAENETGASSTSTPAAESRPTTLPTMIPDVVKADTTSPVVVPISNQQPQSFGLGEAMAFGGPAPETINGRLAMLGFIAAVGAEVFTGQTIAQQAAHATGPVLATFAIFIVASLIPLLRGADQLESFGPLTPRVEKFNGQAAMLGFASLLVLEAVSGKAVF